MLRWIASHLHERDPMSQDSTNQKPRPAVGEHPEQRRQEETDHEDASDPGEVGQPPSRSQSSKKFENAA